MQYMAEIKAFYNLVQVKQLSTGQIALWHALMHINNTCAWIEWFTVPNLTLELNTGLSRSGIYKARNVLKQHGIIDFKPNGTKATSYKMLSLLNSNQVGKQVGNQTNVPMQDSNQVSNQDGKQVGNQDGKQVGNTLNIQDNTIQDETNNINNKENDISIIANAFEHNGFGTIDFMTKEILADLVEDYSTEWILEAMKIAVKSNARNLNFVNKILSNWKSWGGMKLSKGDNEVSEKEGVKDGSARANSKKNFKFDKSQFLWNGNGGESQI